MVSLVFGIISFVAAFSVGIPLIVFGAKENEPAAKYSGVGGMIGGLILGAVLTIVPCFASVPTGCTGILTTFGKVENVTLEAGIHTKAPWQDVITMDNRIQKETVQLESFSSDIQEVKVIYTVNYQIRKADAMTIYSTVGVSYYETVVQPATLEAVKVATAKYTAEALISDRTDLAKSIEELLSDSLDSYNIIVVSTAIEDMDFSDAFTNAVEAKQVAAQNKLQAQIEQEQKTMEAQEAAKRAEIEARAAAEVAKIQAEADMEVAKIGADSAEYQGQKDGSIILQYLLSLNGYHLAEDKVTILDADGNAVSAEQMDEATKNLLQYYYIIGWNGELPSVIAGESSSILIPAM